MLLQKDRPTNNGDPDALSGVSNRRTTAEHTTKTEPRLQFDPRHIDGDDGDMESGDEEELSSARTIYGDKVAGSGKAKPNSIDVPEIGRGTTSSSAFPRLLRGRGLGWSFELSVTCVWCWVRGFAVNISVCVLSQGLRRQASVCGVVRGFAVRRPFRVCGVESGASPSSPPCVWC